MAINRSRIAVAAAVLQIALGALGAWSVFSVPLSKQFGWSISEVTLTFSVCVFVLGFASFFGGLWLSRRGPRVVAVTGSLLYGAGLLLASFSNRGLWWLYFSYGLIAGTGLGFCNIVPIAVLVKWFPQELGDRVAQMISSPRPLRTAVSMKRLRPLACSRAETWVVLLLSFREDRHTMLVLRYLIGLGCRVGQDSNHH